MATLEVLGSSSLGNAYILRCKHSLLVIECGIRYSDILWQIDTDLKNLCGVLVSHRHTDHAKYVSSFLKRRIPVYSNKDVSECFDGVKVLLPYQSVKIGEFLVKPIPAFHNVECYAFQIEHDEIGKVIFATDTFRFPYIFPKVNHIFIEANYDMSIYYEKFFDIYSQSGNHFEINDCVDFLEKNKNEFLKSVVLLHLSDSNSNEVEFVNRAKSATQIENVFVADAGKTFQL